MLSVEEVLACNDCLPEVATVEVGVLAASFCASSQTRECVAEHGFQWNFTKRRLAASR